MFDVYCSYSQTAAYCFIRGKCYLFRLPFYMHLMRGGAVNVGHTLFLEKKQTSGEDDGCLLLCR